MMKKINYRWFYTSSKKLVICGKNSDQNERLMKEIKPTDVIVHTSTPGSPFCIIKNPSSKDLKEVSIFCTCFSQQWKKKKKTAEVHIFRGNQVYKDKKMKKGTFGVLGKVQKKKVPLVLYLKKQKGVLRAVPFVTKHRILPGRIPKEKVAEIIAEKLKVKKQEVLQAIPAGGFKL
ncbi:MAG: DUF814 domain-containing protein [archaeon]|nr:MAG: DUF814 domain-containing protein [archaeon]